MRVLHEMNSGKVTAVIPPMSVPPEAVEDATANFSKTLGHGRFTTYEGRWRDEGVLVKVCDTDTFVPALAEASQGTPLKAGEEAEHCGWGGA